MRCSLTVNTIEDLTNAINVMLDKFDGYFIQIKPKLSTDLRNVTFHLGVPAKTKQRNFLPLIGEL
jgi:hypothetical protein